MKTHMKEVMTKDVEVIPPGCTVQDAAQKMKDLNIGALPICSHDKLVGMITDRDIVIRVVACGLDPRTIEVETAMSSPIVYCFEDQDITDAVRLMEIKQIRRLPVINHEKRLVGMVSLGDLVVKTEGSELKAEVIQRVSEPTRGQVA